MKRNIISAFLLCSCCLSSLAGPLKPEDVPAPLKPWVDWSLRGYEQSLCPFFLGDAETRWCAWPSELNLNLDSKGGRFSQSWRMYSDAWAMLPGDAKRWPQEATVDGKPAALVTLNGAPCVLLAKGVHRVAGAFTWDSLPELLSLPRVTGLLSLTVNGASVPFPERDDAGRLWLQRTRSAPGGEAALEVIVHRRLTDEVPPMLTTHVRLKVSGQNREVRLGRALPEKFTPMYVRGSLPARIDPDGRLRVQVRPGTWDLTLGARFTGKADPITLRDPGGPWDMNEVWVFEARPSLRSVSPEGFAAIDPQQTELPANWKSLPAYIARPGDTLRLVQNKRGDEGMPADSLNLTRTFWLDFNGRGLTVHDNISGIMRKGRRLEMSPGAVLGRVSVDGADQFITALTTGGPAGVETRQGGLLLSAESRIETRGRKFPAAGWNRDFDSLSAMLRLPPGWRVIHVGGPDRAYPTWASSWTLLDFFLCLIIALAVGRLLDRRWAIAAAAALALCWHEPAAPRWSWLILLAAEALRRALPEGAALRRIRIVRTFAAGLLFILLLPFVLEQARMFHPQLETIENAQKFASLSSGFAGRSYGFEKLRSKSLHQAMYFQNSSEEPGAGLAGASLDRSDSSNEMEEDKAQRPMEIASLKRLGFNKMGEEEARQPERKTLAMKGALGKAKFSGRVGGRAGAGGGAGGVGNALDMMKPVRSSARMQSYSNTMAPDPNSKVSTGPGLPDWQWREVGLTWRGPVDAGQELRLWLIPPGVNKFLAAARVFLLLILALAVAGAPVERWALTIRARLMALRGAPLALILLLASMPCAAQQMPSKELLDELRARLTEKPDCSPDCAQISRMRLSAAAGRLTLRLDISAGALTAVPLPGGVKGWLPDHVVVDGQPAAGVATGLDDSLWLALSPGGHQVVLEGPLPDKDSVQLPLPLRPKQVSVEASGWTVDGVREDGVPDANLQLSRVRGGGADSTAAMKRDILKPFVLVERTIELGLSWQAHTRVTRLTPAGAPVVLDIPLLPGESITSAGVHAAKGMAKVSMGPQAAELAWDSVLGESAVIKLRAPDSASWVESWRLDSSPVWHAEASGIPAVLPQGNEGGTREWRPWPGETVEIAITRPVGVPGRTFTFDSAKLALSQGKRAVDGSLELAFRSSRGGQHAVLIPDGAELQRVTVDGVTQPLQQDGRRVLLPVTPGKHGATLEWRLKRGERVFWRAPQTDIGEPGVNAAVTVTFPEDRWLLLAGGPVLGPAVLFWPCLAAFLLAAFGLGKTGWTPLKTRDWFLLFAGLTQLPLQYAVLITAWFLMLARRKVQAPEGRRRFNLMQVALAGFTAAALACLFYALTHGLLSSPEMRIAGNGSTNHLLRWYQDRVPGLLPSPWVVSLPLMCYRLVMLAWALWLAKALLGWLRWAWSCWTAGGTWRRKPQLDEEGSISGRPEKTS